MVESDIVRGTRIQEVIEALDAVYRDIDFAQADWKAASPFQCPDGCGACCVDFEPDVLECEALYLAAWMLVHQRDRAMSLADGSFVSPRDDAADGCRLFDPNSPYHCTVYGGRCLICRLFGYTGDRGKDGSPRWKPCKFLPLSEAAFGPNPHRQYPAAELRDRFGAAPPVMGDIAAQVAAIEPDGQARFPLREALPAAIRRILMVQRFTFMPDPNPEPNPESPMPRAS